MMAPRALRVAPFLLALALLGCRSVAVTDRDPYQGAKLPRPDRILVHDFAVAATDLPTWAEERTRLDPGAPPSAKELALGRELGARVARELVDRIGAMGLPAVRVAGQPEPRPGDIVLIGAFTSVEAGSGAERVIIGFGSGNADLKTHVAGYRMTDLGLRKLGSGSLDTAGGGRSPGLVVPAIVTVATSNPLGLVIGGAVKLTGEATGSSGIEGNAKRTAEKIAEELRVKFEEQGWL